MVEELRLVLQTIRANLATRRREPCADEINAIFSKALEPPENFPYLSGNLDRWLAFLAARRPLREVVFGNRLAPADLCDQFFAWCAGWDQEALRQAISKVRTKL